jgi:hypothetical protein
MELAIFLLLAGLAFLYVDYRDHAGCGVACERKVRP